MMDNNPYNLDLDKLPEGCTYEFLQGGPEWRDKNFHCWKSRSYNYQCSDTAPFADIKEVIEHKHQMFIDKVNDG